MLPGLTCLVSNGIKVIGVYGYGDNLINLWTLHVNRKLFKLVEALRSYGACAVGVIWDPSDTSKFDSDRYVSILPDHLHPFMSIVHSDGLGEFQLDNATPHTSRIATEWLREHCSEFRHYCWPPKSPDINIIEHIWDAWQRVVRRDLHLLLLLLIYGQPCGIHGVHYL
ncbi:transposable element Tcb2 transposase [Trichonephila clavipes]|uniref:Transposable element Tcb2 transposase n=1 Tax=Trichonephila clavipes TaxID=2585209 RepID=A0A8X6RAQ9_TRICX|nr:transposable element Tcb2 transposase [Trichonephila clavipes]